MYAWFVFDVQPINAPIQGGLQAAWQERGRILATPGIGRREPPALSATIIQGYLKASIYFQVALILVD